MGEYLEFAVNIAKYAGNLMKEYFYKDSSIEFKDDRDSVTYVDKTINNYLIEEVGGKVTDFHGNNQKYDRSIDGAIISSGVIHRKLIKKLNDIY